MEWPDSLRALRHPNFRLYFGGQLVSLVGTWMQNVAMSWLAYRIGNLVWLLGAISFAQQIPMLLLAPFMGVILDHVDRLRLLRVTQALSMLPALGAAYLTLTGQVQIWHLMLLAGSLGVINAIDVPARQSLLAGLIEEREDLSNAIALNSVAVNSARLVGPALAGFIVAAIGEGICFLVNAASYLAVLIALFKVRMRRSPSGAKPGLEGLRDGWAYAWHTDSIRTLLLIVATTSLFVAPYAVVMPYYARDVFLGDARALGTLLGCAGAGALMASAFLLTRPDLRGLLAALRTTGIAGGVGVMLFSHCRMMALSGLLLAGIGFCMIVTTAAANTLIQCMVPDTLRGRVMALYSASFIGVVPVGALLVSSVSHAFGVENTLLLAGALALLSNLALTRGAQRVAHNLDTP